MASEKKETSPDLSFEVGYDLKTQKASFKLGLSNVFERIGRKKFGFSASKWLTRRRAKQDAKQGLPGVNQDKPDGREEDIRTQRDDEITQLSDKVTELRQNIGEWISAYSPIKKIYIPTLKADIDAVLSEALHYYRRRFESSRQDFAESMREYESFRIENGLNRRAEVPLFFLKPIAVLLVALLAETIANSFIFAGISTQGMIGGWATAVIVSIINILLGIVFGYTVIRYFTIFDSPWNYVLLVVGGVLVFFAFCFNLYVAHFREVAEAAIMSSRFGEVGLTRDIAPSFSDAWPHFLQNPFNLGSVLGVGLFVIGLCIFGYASYEGYKGFDDPYPNYGKFAKRFYINRFLRMDLEDKARKTCYRNLDRIRDRLEVAGILHAHFKDEVAKAVKLTERLTDVARTAENRIDNHAWSLISAFRATNRRFRLKLSRKATKNPGKDIFDPGEPPYYFSEDPRKNGEWVSLVPDLHELRKQAEEALELIDHNMNIIDEAKKYVAELRTNVDTQLAENLDAEDLTLQEVANNVYQSGHDDKKLRVVNSTQS